MNRVRPVQVPMGSGRDESRPYKHPQDREHYKLL